MKIYFHIVDSFLDHSVKNIGLNTKDKKDSCEKLKISA